MPNSACVLFSPVPRNPFQQLCNAGFLPRNWRLNLDWQFPRRYLIVAQMLTAGSRLESKTTSHNPLGTVALIFPQAKLDGEADRWSYWHCCQTICGVYSQQNLFQGSEEAPTQNQRIKLPSKGIRTEASHISGAMKMLIRQLPNVFLKPACTYLCFNGRLSHATHANRLQEAQAECAST